MNEKDYLIEELQRRDYISPRQIQQAREILIKRESGERSVIRVNECKCWREVSLLNEEDVEYSPIAIWLYNFTGDDGALLQIRDHESILSSLRIRYCPFCGRFLG